MSFDSGLRLPPLIEALTFDSSISHYKGALPIKSLICPMFWTYYSPLFSSDPADHSACQPNFKNFIGLIRVLKTEISLCVPSVPSIVFAQGQNGVKVGGDELCVLTEAHILPALVRVPIALKRHH